MKFDDAILDRHSQPSNVSYPVSVLSFDIPHNHRLTKAGNCVANRSDLDRAFAQMEEQRPEALLFGAGSALLTGTIQTIIHNTTRLGIALCVPDRNVPRLGALIGYGPDLVAGYRLAATYVDKILKGAKPSDLAVQQPTKFELAINLKTAKVLGLNLSPTLLARADEVISSG